MKSPNGKYRVEKRDFMEVRMGSGMFGKVIVHGSSVNLSSRTFGEHMAFSPDSSMLALQQMKIDRKSGVPITNLIVVDLRGGHAKSIARLHGGFLSPIRWENKSKLIYESWAYEDDGPVTKELSWEKDQAK